MTSIDINEFMRRFHELERDLRLFDQRVAGELWWDSVRFDVCYYLFDCLSGLSYSSASKPSPRPRRLGTARRALQRQALFARALARRHKLLVLRAARTLTAGRRHDIVLDPLLSLVADRSLVIETVPRRYHLPDCFAPRGGMVPDTLPSLASALVAGCRVEPDRAARLEALIRSGRAVHACQVDGYRRLLAIARPRAVLLAGVDKPLLQVAHALGIPVVEAQHGLIGFGHPAYSYPQGIDYAGQTGFPDLFLTFSQRSQESGFYPARRQAVLGTRVVEAPAADKREAIGAIMVVSANIYHQELLVTTRHIAERLPGRQILYKLHPNQQVEAAAIARALADLPNVTVGDALTPASHLLPAVSHLVAIQSTVVFEALQQGCRVCLLPRYDYQVHADLLELANVTVADDDALIAALDIAPCPDASPTFFEPFDEARARKLLMPYLDGTADR